MSRFPDRVGILNQSRSIMDVWFTLQEDLEGAYKATPPNADLIDRIWAFADWCFASSRHRTVRNAVAVAFYEHIPHFGPSRRELPRRLPRAAFLELLPAFRTTLEAGPYEEFVTEFLVAQGTTPREAREIASAT